MPLRNFLVIFAVAVISFACYSVTAKNRYANLFAEVLEIVNKEALAEASQEELFTGAMDGMLSNLDEHCSFISDNGFREFEEDLKQEIGGIGVFVGMDSKRKTMIVLAPMPNTPAYEAGIQAGDLIVSIAGEPTADKAQWDAIQKLRGPVGETVELEIVRGEDTLFKTLTRAKIPIESAHGDYRKPDGNWNFFLKDHPNVAYIRLSQFGEMTGGEMKAALHSLPSNAEGLIIDLRANPGGLLDIAVEICDMFLEADLPIVRIKGRDKLLLREYTSTAGTELSNDLPVCILIDRYSASASEILSGCLQDHERAVLIGEQSYGKGTVQDIIPIQYNKSLLKLTTSSYWRPSDKQIDRNDPESQKSKVWGVQPSQGFAIEMSDDEIIENIKHRQQRTSLGIGGLEPKAEDDQTSDEAPSESDSTESSEEETEEDSSPKVPHVDRPLEKAIEFIQSRSSKKLAA